MTDTSIKFQGTKYEATKDLPVKQLAALIRADVRAAVKDGRLPELNPSGGKIKYSIRYRTASMSRAIDVEVSNWGETRQARAYVDRGNGAGFGPDWQTDPDTGEAFMSWMNPRTRKASRILDELHGAYQQDRSDSMTDYFHVRYYGHVQISE